MGIVAGLIIGGKYRVEQVVGEGGMGVVCSATHVTLGHRVAVKVLAEGASRDALAMARFEREARVSASITSEHVVRVFDFGTTDDGLGYLVMEFLEGEDLAARIERSGPLPVREALALFAQACEGLAEAHAKGLVHRDLKPSNLFLTPRAGGGTVLKVIDFGIAKDTNFGGEHAMTRTSDVMGSPQYMSPEQVRDSKNLDARTDVWSLGAAFFEAISGKPPFEAATLTDLLVKIAIADIPPLSVSDGSLPPEVKGLIARCLERDRDRRWSSMVELRDAIRAALEGRASIATTRLEDPRPALAFDATVAGAAEVAREVRDKLVAPSGGRLWKVGLAVALGGVTVAALLRFPGAPEARRGAEADAANPAMGGEPASFLDEPVTSRSEAATMAYREAVQAYRDADLSRASTRLKAAADADAAFPQPQLLLALLGVQSNRTEAQERLQKARALRGSLSTRGQRLADAAARLTQSEWDLDGFERDLLALIDSYPRDPFLWSWVGIGRQFAREIERAREAHERAVALDQTFAPGPWLLGQLLRQSGDLEASVRAFTACLEKNPNAAMCRDNRAQDYAWLGQCAESEQDARSLMASAPEDPRYSALLVQALAAQSKPSVAIQALLDARAPLVPAFQRERDAARLATHEGLFANAVTASERWEAAAASRIDEAIAAVSHRAQVLSEMGDSKGAARAVRAFLEKKDALPGAGPKDDTITLHRYLRDAGALSEAEFRTNWECFIALGSWNATTRADAGAGAAPKFSYWAIGFAKPARTREEARAALDARARFEADSAPYPHIAGHVGHALLLAGEAAQAIPLLERAASSCTGPGDVERYGRLLELGDAYAAAGRTQDACARYAAVLERWGNAKPRSVSADHARAAAKGLACGKLIVP